MRHVILISGKDSLATALVQTARQPSLQYEYVFNDVGCELPETYAWMDSIERKTGWKVTRIGKDLLNIIEEYGGFLPGPRSRYCTRQGKIEPTEAYIGTDDCTVYYGLRADEPRIGYVPIGKPNITVAYPLRDCGIDLQGVYSVLDAQQLTPPDFFWARLHEAVDRKLVAWPGWESKLSRSQRRALFSGRSRANCYGCFFQAQHEYLWLFETHKDLFDRASALEKPGEYSFQPGFFLSELLSERKRSQVFDRRVKQVCKQVVAKFQGTLFEVESDDLSQTSCGLLCGK